MTGPPADSLGAAAIARLASLTEIVRVVASSNDYDNLLEETARAARLALGGSAVSVSRWEKSTGQLRTLINEGDLASWEVSRPEGDAYSVRRDAALTSLIIEGKGYVVSRAGAGDPTQLETLVHAEKNSAVNVPIVVEGQVWGDLWVSRSVDEPEFTELDLDYATVVAVQVATAIAAGERLDRISRLAYTDPLTGLANRRAVDERIEQGLAAHTDSNVPASLLVCDVNALKAINDEGGHEAGDRVLVSFAAELSTAAALASGSLAARLGGDEFCIVMNGISGDRAAVVADDLSRRADRVTPHGVSCGVASTDDDVGLVRSPARLFRLADAAQYRAKRSHSSSPVVAGRSLATATDEAARETEVGASADRRVVRGRARIDVGRVLDLGLAALDHGTVHDIAERLELVADLLARSLDASGWWISRSPAGADYVETVGYAGHRTANAETGETDDEIGTKFSLETFPLTEKALAGRALTVSVDDPKADAAEVAIIQGMGCVGLLVAGDVDRSGDGWLVEIFGDEISSPLEPMATVARALVVIAVGQASRQL